MAQLNKEKLRRILNTDSNSTFKKQMRRFRDALDKERKITSLSTAATCSRLKQALIDDWRGFAADEGIPRGDAQLDAMRIACMPEEKLVGLKGAAFSGFDEFQQTLMGLITKGDAQLAEREDALSRTLESGVALQLELVHASLDSKDAFCNWAQDQELHIEMIRLSSQSCAETIRDVWAIPKLSTEGFLRATECWIEALRIYADIQKITAHAYIATQGLGVEFPGSMKSALERGILLPTWEQLTPEKYEDCIWRISFVPPEDIARELLRMLFPRKWKKMLGDCMAEAKVSLPPEGHSLPTKHLAIAKRLMKEYPDDSFSESFVGGLGGACGWDEGKAVSVVELGYYGLEMEDAVFLVNQKLDDVIVGKHTLVASILEAEKISHQEVHYAFMVLNEDSCWDMVEKLPDYLGWMEVMPGKWDENGKQELSAVLALAARPPSSRARVHAVLRENADKVIDRIIELESGKGRLEKAFFEYFEYSGRFVKERAAAGEESETVVERTPVRRVERPHESLVFSQEVGQYIESKGILVENVRRTIIYGLRLSSRKSAIGGKYFPITAFRHNVRVVLSKEGGNPEERVGVIEDFLYKEGVISYYKQGDVVKLNLKDEIGQHNEPSEIGQQMLDSVISWKVEFDRKTKGNGS